MRRIALEYGWTQDYILDHISLGEVGPLLDSANERLEEVSLQLRFFLWAEQEALKEYDAQKGRGPGPGDDGILELAREAGNERAVRDIERKRHIRELLKGSEHG